MDDAPEFIAVRPSWEGPPPPSHRAPGPGPGRRGRGVHLPWLLLALAAATMAWLSFFVIVPLRHEALVCQEQLRVAMATMLESDNAPKALAAAAASEDRDQGLAAPAEPGQAGGEDPLFMALSRTLTPLVDAGAVSAHPDEATVRLAVPAPRSGTQDEQVLPQVLQAVAQTLSQGHGAWRLEALIGGVSGQEMGERPGRRGRGKYPGRYGHRAASLSRLLVQLDEALTPHHIPWGLALGALPAGEVQLVLRPEAVAG